MIEAVMELCGDALTAPGPIDASHAFDRAARRRGASYLQTRSYRRPKARLTSDNHFAAGGVVLRSAPKDWPGSAAFHYVCFEQNPQLEPIRQGLTRYRFSDFAPRHDRRFLRYWDSLGEAGIADALCATAYGPAGRIASLHLGVPDGQLDPSDVTAMHLAGGILVETLMKFATADDAAHEASITPEPAITARERDALSYVAEGKTDWEIAVILGVSEATARFHVDNARRKLGAVNRAHAVARFIARGEMG